VHADFQHLDVTRAVPPHEGKQLAKEQVTQRLFAQAGIGRMRRGLDFGWLGNLGRLGHGDLIQ
jgi:hypothetical protein